MRPKEWQKIISNITFAFLKFEIISIFVVENEVFHCRSLLPTKMEREQLIGLKILSSFFMVQVVRLMLSYTPV